MKLIYPTSVKAFAARVEWLEQVIESVRRRAIATRSSQADALAAMTAARSDLYRGYRDELRTGPAPVIDLDAAFVTDATP